MKCTVTAEYSAVIAQSIHMVIGYSKSGGKKQELAWYISILICR